MFEAARQKVHVSLGEIILIVLEPNGAMSFLKDARGAAVPDRSR